MDPNFSREISQPDFRRRLTDKFHEWCIFDHSSGSLLTFGCPIFRLLERATLLQSLLDKVMPSKGIRSDLHPMTVPRKNLLEHFLILLLFSRKIPQTQLS